jgi:hypothetical protein
MINDFCIESKLDKSDLIDLLLKKAARNYETHGVIDDIVDELINTQYTNNQLIEYLKNKIDVTLTITSKEKDMIIKLLQVNINRHNNQLMNI